MFKDKLKKLREDKGLSQQKLADDIFVSRSTIAKWENGLGLPSDVNLETLCKYFEVKEEWLLERKELKQTLDINNKTQTIFNTSFIIMIAMTTLFCLVIGGDYTLHRIAIIFSIIYYILLIFVKNCVLRKIFKITCFVVTIVISLLNWFITAIPEPSNFFRIFYYHSTLNGWRLSFSQLSSILNLFMVISTCILTNIFKKYKKLK